MKHIAQAAVQRLLASVSMFEETLTSTPEQWAKTNGFTLLKEAKTYAVQQHGRKIGSLVQDRGSWKFVKAPTDEELRDLKLETWSPTHDADKYLLND